MPALSDVQRFLGDEHGLMVVTTMQADGRPLSSVVNGAVTAHPVSQRSCVAFVSSGRAARLIHIRRGSFVTVAVRRGWQWVGVTGPADIVGPDDPIAEPGGPDLTSLLRAVFAAAGGTHDDLDEYDRVMRAERRACVFVLPERIVGDV